jgi:hypothetical protein
MVFAAESYAESIDCVKFPFGPLKALLGPAIPDNKELEISAAIPKPDPILFNLSFYSLDSLPPVSLPPVSLPPVLLPSVSLPSVSLPSVFSPVFAVVPVLPPVFAVLVFTVLVFPKFIVPVLRDGKVNA